MIERNPNCIGSCELHETMCQRVDAKNDGIDQVQNHIDRARESQNVSSLAINEIEFDVTADIKMRIQLELDARGIPYTDEDIDSWIADETSGALHERIERANANIAHFDITQQRLEIQKTQNNELADKLKACEGPTIRKKLFGRQAIVCSSFTQN